ncbi:MAG: acyl-coenzyme A thioesterase PaaI-like protein [Pseudohongiellaceae bacterium]|jgi:acyl-coenzyme A thioesterase PaaI-like protein
MTLVQQLLDAWGQLSGTAEGRALFDERLGQAVPYTGTIEPHVLELSPGQALVAMDDIPTVRNHLNSIHAVAMMNLGEVSSGLALLSGLPSDARAILVGLNIEYHKKARGRITARSQCEPLSSNGQARLSVAAELTDDAGDAVASVTAQWAVGPA